MVKYVALIGKEEYLPTEYWGTDDIETHERVCKEATVTLNGKEYEIVGWVLKADDDEYGEQ